jgi:Domain of unknown function (DUF397)
MTAAQLCKQPLIGVAVDDAVGHSPEIAAAYPALTEAVWKKSTRSTHAGNCVEVAGLSGRTVGVRDSKESGPARTVLVFPAQTWNCFLAGVKAGEFPLL